MSKIMEMLNLYKVGDKVIMKAPRKNSSLGYGKTKGRVLTISAILPQYGDAFTAEEFGSEELYRLRDIASLAQR